jgi:glycosyltransferase involved in cell wall biosynthesis
VRVLQLNNEYPPLGGGTATVTAEVSKQLRNHPAIENVLVTSSGDGTFSNSFDESTGMTITKLPLKQKCVHHASVFDLLGYGWSAWRMARKCHAASPFDVVFAWCTVPAGFVAYIINKRFGVPYIVRVSGPDIPGFERRYRFLYPLLKPILVRIWDSAHCVVCKCPEEAERVRSVMPTVRIELVPNGVDILTYRPKLEKNESGVLRLLCVARLIERKGQRIALEAVAELNRAGIPVQLILVGDGDSREAYEALSRTLGIETHVEFRGSAPREAMPEIYREADIFILPSSAESMSVACLEALASGLPLVVSAGGGAESFVESGRNGFLVPSHQTSGFVRAVSALHEDRKLLSTFGAHSRKIAERFSWTAASDALLALLDEAVSTQS